jgi:lysophospholipase L1-like esterase
MTWHRFVALGDSLTEGVGDPQPGGELRGWAARLARGLEGFEHDFEFVNFARRSLLTHEILERQLPRALELRPDLVSAVVGMNDLMRSDFRPHVFEAEVDSIVGALSEAGATVLTASFPDVSRFLPAPRRVREPIAARLEAASDVIRSVANKRQALFVDVWHMTEAQSRNIISIDCVHPNERGHLLLARVFADLLEERAGVRIELPDPPSGRILSRGTLLHLQWIATNAIPEAMRFIRRLVRSA